MEIAIVDDDKVFLKDLYRNIADELSNHCCYYQIYTFQSSYDFIHAINDRKFDYVFLDIEMPEISGFEVAKIINEACANTNIIFVTNHDCLVYNCFDFMPLLFVDRKSVV